MQKQWENRILSLEDIKKIRPNLDVLKTISFEVSEKAEIIFFDIKGKTVSAITTNNNIILLNQVKQKVEDKWYKIELFYTDEESFTHSLSWYTELKVLQNKSKKEIEELENASGLWALDMIKKVYDNKNKYAETDFIKEIIKLAFASWSSDAHFQPEEDGVWFRIRKDGVLKKIIVFTHAEFTRYLIKLKSLSKVKLNINYIPQDGRFDFISKKWWRSYKIDVRVNFMPVLYGESVVMRFLDGSSWIRSFTDIGFIWKSYDILQRNIEKPYGMILVTWPTGSWKSTTLYSILNKLNLPDKKIITLENPVEYSLPNIQQSQINTKKWYTYSEGLKAILRQDPDIIMVWEIRDYETAIIAINAALTWHLVLSTLHTNTAIEAVNRLINMWVQPFMLAPALNLIIWQRLLRKLCDCKTLIEASYWEKEDIEISLNKINNVVPSLKLKFDWKIYKEAWCEKCWYDWYNGRIAIVETFEVTEEVKNQIIKWATSLEIFQTARESWYLTMKEDAYIKMLKGYTTIWEIRRVLNT